MKIRKAQFAGKFYPEEASELAGMVDGFLRDAKEVSLPQGAKLKAIIVPHAGYIYSGIVAASGFKLLKSLRLLKKVILIGPSHNEYFEGVVEDDADWWESPLGRVPVSHLCNLSNLSNLSNTENEHSLEVQIPFLQRVLKGFEIVPIMYGEEEAEDLGDKLLKSLKELKYKGAIIIVSSDLSHYYPYEEAVNIDRAANEAIPELDIDRVEKEVEACGKTGILAIMYVAKKMGWKGILLDYRNSGDTAGDKERVVGYGCYGFYELR